VSQPASPSGAPDPVSTEDWRVRIVGIPFPRAAKSHSGQRNCSRNGRPELGEPVHPTLHGQFTSGPGPLFSKVPAAIRS
jgi:hypothetical protein